MNLSSGAIDRPMHKEIIQSSRILIVDDQPANVALMDRVLRQAGYSHIASINDPRQFIDQFRIFQPDLVVLDLMMPHVSGFSLMTQLHGWIPDNTYLPILVLTADVSKAARQKALSLGAKDFLTKPIDTMEATLRIYNLLETRWLYTHLLSRHKIFLAEVSKSQAQLNAAGSELERLGRGAITAAQLDTVRTHISQANDMMRRIGETVQGFDLATCIGQRELRPENEDAALAKSLST
jgi:CheY-like chemotaxis protein